MDSTQKKCSQPNLHTAAFLNIEPLGTIICAVNSQDRSAIARNFSDQMLARVVQYFARQVWFNILQG
jgi:hypothetical protein